jgi:hypothetical protein
LICDSVCCWTLMSIISSSRLKNVIGCMTGMEHAAGQF